MTTLYGIKNCDTVRKAMKWLEANHIEFTFHDFRTDGLTETKINSWLAELGNATVVNKRSTTWKTLSEEQQTQLIHGDAAPILAEHPTLIKRPVLEYAQSVSVGFKDDMYQSIIKSC